MNDIFLHLCTSTKFSVAKFFKISQTQKSVPQKIFQIWTSILKNIATKINAALINAFLVDLIH